MAESTRESSSTKPSESEGNSQAKGPINEVIGAVESLLLYVSKFWAHLISLGTALDIEDYTLAIVQGDKSVEDKCLLILKRWLIVCPNPTWKMFCDALKKYDQAFADVRMQIQRDHGIESDESIQGGDKKSFVVRQKSKDMQVTQKNNEVIFVNMANRSLVQLERPGPMNQAFNYFEIQIIGDAGSFAVGIGLGPEVYPLTLTNSMPGWDIDCIGYHSDDGNLFKRTGLGDAFGPQCSVGDIMGCGVDFVDSETEGMAYVWFSKNGVLAGPPIDFSIPQGGFFPLIGIETEGQVAMSVKYLGHKNLEPPAYLKDPTKIGAVENLLPYTPYFLAYLNYLGTVLGLTGSHTQAIVQGNQNHGDSKCRQILNIWLTNCPNATWKMFCDALKKSDRAFADVRVKIQRDHEIGQQTMQPSPRPVVDRQRTLALREAHKKLKRFYTKPAKCKHFVNLALVERPPKVDKTKKDMKEFLEATARGIDRYTVEQKNIEYEAILTRTGSDSGKRVLISGPPGSGKTTLAHQLCRDLYSGHLPNQYQLVLLAELKAFRSYTSKKNKEASLLTLLEYLDLPETDSLCSMIRKEEGRGVAIILDGYDEISDASCKTLTEWVSEVFCDECLPVSECDVFITTRPSQLSQLAEVASVHLEILGFSSSDIECYIKAYFKDAPDRAEEVIRRLTDLPLVEGLCSNPRVLEIACKILKHEDEEPLPANLSGIFLRYLRYQLETDLKDRQPPIETRILDLLSVSKELFPGFYTLCSLAYHCCLRQQLMLEKRELGEVMNYINSRERVYNLLFGGQVDSPAAISCMLYQCDHKTVMEALAAVHIAVLSPAEQQQIWEEWFTAPHMAQVWMMYCGLTGLKSVDLRRLCFLTVSERSREVVKDLEADALYDEDKLVMVSLFEASNDEEAKRVLPVLLKNTIRGYVWSQHNVLCLAYSITHHPHLSRVRLERSAYFSELDLQPLTTSLMNVKAIELECVRLKPMLTVLPRAVEDLSINLLLGPTFYEGLGDALRDCHYLRSLTIKVDTTAAQLLHMTIDVENKPHSALWTELDSVLNSNRLTELHLKSVFKYGSVDPPSMETLENLLVHREKCSLKMGLTNHQLSALLSGLKRADQLKELDLEITVSDPEVNPDQCLVTCAEVEELVATHPHLVKVDVESFSYKGGLFIAVAKGAIRNKNITHLGRGIPETRAVHPLLYSPSADHITSIRAWYLRGFICGDDDAWSKGVIAGPMARQTCHLHLLEFTSASLGLLLSRVNTATKLKDLSLTVLPVTVDDIVNSVHVVACVLDCNKYPI